MKNWQRIALVTLCMACAPSSTPQAPSDTDTDTSADTDVDTDVDTDTDTDTDTEVENGAPVILDFGVNSAVLTDVREVVVTAVVTDPDGIEDLIGGTLKDASGASYGAFATASQEGAYEARLRWSDANAARTIHFGEGRSGTRTLVAEFFDQAGNRTSSETSIRLECDASDERPCDGGLCDLPDTVEHCGRCDNACDDDDAVPPLVGDTELVEENPLQGLYPHACVDQVCQYDLVSWEAYITCDEVCGEDHECIRATIHGDDTASCDRWSSGGVIRCRCRAR